MSLSDLMQEIEGEAFDARVSAANDIAIFAQAVESEPAIRSLFGLMDASVQERVLYRLRSLLNERNDVRYRNPRDVAIAAYVFALGKSDDTFGNLAAITVQTTAQRCWWATKIARQIADGSIRAPRQTKNVLVCTPDLLLNIFTSADENLVLVLPTGLHFLGNGLLFPAPSTPTSWSEEIRQPWEGIPASLTTTNRGIAAS